MRKIKICYITTLPQTVRWFLINTIKYLSEQTDWDITVVCNITEGFDKELPNGVKYVPLKIRRGISISAIGSIVQLYRLFKKESYDMIQYSTANAGCYASIAGKMCGIPIRIYGQWGIDYIYFSGIKKFIFEAIERVICNNSTNIQPDSFENLDIALKQKLYPKEKGAVIGYGSACGVDLSRFDYKQKKVWRNKIRNDYKIANDCFVFGFVGRILGQKGINELLTAVKNIILSNPKVCILLVGPLDRTDGVEEDLLEWAKSTPNVIMTGYTNKPEQFLSAMDCFVFPSYREGFGSATIEAAAMNVPVIASDIPGPRETIQNGVTGLLVPKEDEKALEQAMRELLGDQSLREMYSQREYELVKERYDQKYVLERVYENRKQLIDGLSNDTLHQ